MNIKRIIEYCTISALSLFVLSCSVYQPVQYNVQAKNVKCARQYHHRSMWYYNTISRLSFRQYEHPSHHNRNLVNQAFHKYNKHLSNAQLVRLQKHACIYHLLYQANKKYYYHILWNILCSKPKHQLGQRHAKAQSFSKPNTKHSSFNAELRYYIIKDMNNTREHYHVPPLKVSSMMQKAADYRSKKVLFGYEHPLYCLRYEHLTREQLEDMGGTTDNWIHGLDTHTSINDFLKKHRYSPNYDGENAASWMVATHCTNDDGTIDKMTDTTPKGIAYNTNDDFINHDMTHGNNNGHRKNELNRHYKYVGVGVQYNKKKNLGSINIQFAS